MYGLIQSNAGEPRSMGQKIVLNGLSRARKSGIDIVFQHFSRFENPTVAENIAPGLPAMKFLTAISARSAETARRYGLPLDPKREVWRLSAGSGGASRLSGRSLGYIASFPIPEVISGVNATMLGAQSDNPNIKFKIIRARTWFDRRKEADAAKALVDQHADVLMQHTDSPAAMQIIAQRGILAFGQDSDMIKFGPKSQLTAIIDNWRPYYIQRANAVLSGSWKSTDTWGGLGSDLVVMAPYTNMPDDVKALAMKTKAAVKDGTLHPFKCPILTRDGQTV